MQGERPTMFTCRDCGKPMTPEDRRFYKGVGFEWQWAVDYKYEGCCRPCLEKRERDGDTIDDFIAEFCG